MTVSPGRASSSGREGDRLAVDRSIRLSDAGVQSKAEAVLGTFKAIFGIEFANNAKRCRVVG